MSVAPASAHEMAAFGAGTPIFSLVQVRVAADCVEEPNCLMIRKHAQAARLFWYLLSTYMQLVQPPKAICGG